MYKTKDGFYCINVKKIFDLPCYDSRKSFYGKAKVIISEDNTIFLQSYNTLVCCINPDNTFNKLWDSYSTTTMRHINSFMKHYDIFAGGKKWWDSLEVWKSNGVRQYYTIDNLNNIFKAV